MEKHLPAIEVESAPDPEFAVIWLHGLGADGSDFVPIVPELGMDEDLRIRFIFPHAPYMPVTCNGGYIMRAWYDILSLAPNSRRVDEAGILQSREAVRALIASENARGIPCRKIFLAGFSQGGAIAYTTALTHPDRLGGVMALSTYLPVPELVLAEATDSNREIPIFAAHGSEDDVVAEGLGLAARDFLVEQGYRVEWHRYRMPHSVCPEEIEALGAWLQSRMNSLRGA